ncbi:MAG: hypothetical protein WEC80_01530, partial [Patescibacteria group bacterium]
MIDDPETPTVGTGEGQEQPQHDDHGQRQEERESQDNQILANQRSQELLNAISDAVEENPEVTKWSSEFVSNWHQYFRDRFQAKHARVLNALHSVEAYDEYIGIKKVELLKKQGKKAADIAVNENTKKIFYKDLSADIERDIVLTISELYIRVDEASPDETFEEIIQADFMQSIRVNYDRILNKLNLLKKNIAAQGHQDRLP